MEDKSKLKLIYEDGKPVMKMESDGVRMTFRFAEQEPETDVKENIVNILTSQFIRRTVSAPLDRTLRENDLQSKRGFLQPL